MKKILAFITVLALALPAFAESPNFNPVDNLKGKVISLDGSAATNIYGPIIQLRRDRPLVVQTTMVGTNAAASNAVTSVFRYSNDGKYWTTSASTSAVTATGTNAITGITSVTNGTGVTAIFPRYAQLWYLTNAAAATTGRVSVSNVVSGVWDP